MTESAFHDRAGVRADVRATPTSRRVPVHVVVLGAYTVLALALSWPLIAQIGTHIPRRTAVGV